MPVASGTNLLRLIRDQSLHLGEVVDLGIQAAEALDYSHSRGVVHRDIKPANIMITRDEGASVRVRVMDFGLAHSSTESRLTKTGTLVGTVAYLSPEQVASRAFDGRSDIYSLGVVLYECLLGEPPFTGEVQSILYRIVHEIPQPPRALGAEIREELQDIILRCLEKDAARRPAESGPGRRRPAAPQVDPRDGRVPDVGRALREPDDSAARPLALHRAREGVRGAATPPERGPVGRLPVRRGGGRAGNREDAPPRGAQEPREGAEDPGSVRAVRRAGPVLLVPGIFRGHPGLFPLPRRELVGRAARLLGPRRRSDGSLPAAVRGLRTARRRRRRLANRGARRRAQGRGPHPDLRAARPDAHAHCRRQAPRPDPREPPRGRDLDRGPAVHRPPPRADADPDRRQLSSDRDGSPAPADEDARLLRGRSALRLPDASSLLALGASGPGRVARRRPEGLGRARPEAAGRDRGKSVFHQGAPPLPRRVGRHRARRHGRLELLEGGRDLGRRPAGDHPAGRRETDRAPARRATRSSLDRLGAGKDVRLPRPRDARRRSKGSRGLDRPADSRGHPGGGPRVPRRPADVRERHRPRRPLRSALAPAAEVASIASTPSSSRSARPAGSNASTPSSSITTGRATCRRRRSTTR